MKPFPQNVALATVHEHRNNAKPHLVNPAGGDQGGAGGKDYACGAQTAATCAKTVIGPVPLSRQRLRTGGVSGARIGGRPVGDSLPLCGPSIDSRENCELRQRLLG
jgi:hypothetical protein